jgi:KUP system potassium uptake protein
VLAFQTSSNLAAAYGIAVTGTMAITSIAYYVVARQRWGWSLTKVVPLVSAFLVIDLAFLGSNALKFFHGGFVPVVIALGIFFAMAVWKRGRALLGGYFQRAARPLDAFLEGVGKGVFDDDGEAVPLVRVKGAAVFLTSNASGTPPLLMHHARHNKAVHETVVLVTVTSERVPRVTTDRIRLEPLSEGFFRLFVRVGFMETPNVPRALGVAIKAYKLPFELKQVTYYLGRETLLATGRGEMSARAEAVFAFLTKNSQNATRYFGIPPERVVEIGMQIDL